MKIDHDAVSTGDDDEEFAALQAAQQQAVAARNLADDAYAPGPGLTVNDSRVHNLVQAATIGEIHLHQPSPSQTHSFANGPLCIGRIPALAAARQARAADTALADSLRNGSTAVLGQVLSGLGGVGKTQIAAAYARTRWDAGDLDLLVWVNATERESITAAYILDQPGLSCEDYCELLADRAHTLADLSPRVLPDDYAHSVAASLLLSIERAYLRQQPTGLAIGILFLASFLDPAGVPADLFTTENALRVYSAVIARAGGRPGTPITERDIRVALGNLHLLCLIDSDGDTIRIHALVQRVLRDGLNTAERGYCVEAAANVLFAAWPNPENDPPRSAILRANTARHDR